METGNRIDKNNNNNDDADGKENIRLKVARDKRGGGVVKESIGPWGSHSTGGADHPGLVP